MSRLLKYIFLFCVLSTTVYQLSAQDIQVFTKLDTNKIKLGEQTRMHLKIIRPKNQEVKWPFIPDTISKVEIIQKSKIDTISKDDKSITESVSMLITSFDSGYYVIPPFIFNWKKSGDTTLYTAETEAQLFSVTGIPVDTTQNIKDIKKPLDVPFNWMDTLPYVGGGILLVLIVFLIWYLFKNRKKTIAEIITKVPYIPPHEKALQALQSLEKEKLWQQGQFKAYYSGISDIIRGYIEERYQVQALEHTTEETLRGLRSENLSKELEDKLRSMLELSDLVKFAKLQPVSMENENIIKQAYQFVNETIVQEKTEKEEKGKEDIK